MHLTKKRVQGARVQGRATTVYHATLECVLLLYRMCSLNRER
jgi:hypothetical protein